MTAWEYAKGRIMHDVFWPLTVLGLLAVGFSVALAVAFVSDWLRGRRLRRGGRR